MVTSPPGSAVINHQLSEMSPTYSDCSWAWAFPVPLLSSALTPVTAMGRGLGLGGRLSFLLWPPYAGHNRLVNPAGPCPTEHSTGVSSGGRAQAGWPWTVPFPAHYLGRGWVWPELAAFLLFLDSAMPLRGA